MITILAQEFRALGFRVLGFRAQGLYRVALGFRASVVQGFTRVPFTLWGFGAYIL